MGRSGLRVLVVDDNLLIRKAICKLLQSQEDIEIVCVASDGSDAARLAKEHKPDLIIMDISMPVMNGLDAARLIKRDLPAIRILFLSQYGSRSFMREAVSAGASGFVTKDDAWQELIPEVRRIQSELLSDKSGQLEA